MTRFYTFKKQVPLKPDERLGYQRGKGYYVIPAPKPPPPIPLQPAASAFAGKGIFTTSESGAASHPCDWYAVQADPEGNDDSANTNGRKCFWMARPTAEMVTYANTHSIPFIAQAESQPELDKALALGPSIRVPKALVGNPNPKSWTKESFDKAVAQGWELILEWYWNAHPWETQPDANNYPYFTNVCFGIYSEGEPGGQGYVQQIPLSDYRAVWHGSFSVWKAEAMTPADWAVFEA